MKKFRLLIVAVFGIIMALTFAACGGNDGGDQTNIPNDELTGESNVLVTYFSWSASNNTKTMAEYVAEYTGGEIFRIQPKTPYTTVYNDVIEVAQKERNENVRPELYENVTAEQLENYDVIFVGYPVWWYDAPMIIYSFLEANDYSGKKVVTFATSGGSGISDSNLRSKIDADFTSGLCISNFSAGSSAKNRVENWITELGYHK